MLEHAPLRVQSRYRCYTDERQRDAIDTLDEPYGRGTPLTVGIVATDRSPEWGTYGQMASFPSTLGYYGEISIPAQVVETLSLSVGEMVTVTARRVYE